MIRLNDILDRTLSYNPGANLDVIKRAYVFSAKVHQGQMRLSGEPYLVHPIEVGGILTDLRMDVDSIATGLLHDVVEDAWTELDQIESTFGKEISTLVDGVTKISQISYGTSEKRQAENLRKMIVAMTKDVRVILIKLADRLHNMRTLEYHEEDKRVKISQETRDIYAPLAHRLGINWLRSELDDLSFMHLNSERYYRLAKRIAKSRKEREKYIKEVEGIIKEILTKQGITADVSGRPKNLYSINQKMEKYDLDFDQVYDIIAFRVIVGSIRDCYQALGTIHSHWKPIPQRIKDYIAMPKANGYQSLHTTVIGPYGERVEIQIRTEQMHSVAEGGIAAHWKYKEGKVIQEKSDWEFAWLRQLLEWQQEVPDATEFLNTVKLDLFPNEVFVFTPRGDVKEFPKGATPVDFAYSIHTDIGNRCAGAKITGRIVSLKAELKNGDIVEIITSPTQKPNKDWLRFVKTSKAKAKIRQWTAREQRERKSALGRELLEKDFRKHGLNFSRLTRSGEMEKVARECNYKEAEALIAAVGSGILPSSQIIKRLVREEGLKPGEVPVLPKAIRKTASQSPTAISIMGVDDIMVRFGKCCNPLPGDSVMGFITRGRGVTVHKADCPWALESDQERRLEVQWDPRAQSLRPAKIKVVCIDRPGMLAQITQSIASVDVNIKKAKAQTTMDKKAINIFELDVRDIAHLRNVIKSVEKVGGVISVERLSG
ncbi:MAG: bifunctional (p)ppGpp synthetase/guanosine-3',5'-bis(diphosphate) 3'-pyrophosphohydrolase [Deltaproteobacteria bacterium]|nr:MAG: bifunctional (p)ppGpp synthetase/guanosine-3',5'-bis(diphosphate) 3'-pyrophosphohydrolase [Deltaproteobacteria bacterium]